MPGAWIYSASEAKQQFGREASEVNAEETRALIRMANQNPNIERVLVGNENILRWDGQKNLRDPNATSPAQLIREIRNVKRNVKVPVSTAEPWHVWLELSRARARGRLSRRPHPALLGREVGRDAARVSEERIAKLKEAEYLRNKNIIVTEVGWPSNGAARRSPGTGAVKYATPAEQAKNVRDMVAWLKSQNIDYFVVEAVDQPWKSYDLEGKAGGYWGLWNADRQPKFAWTGPVERFPQWWAGAAWSLAAVAAGDAVLPVALAARSALAGQVGFCGLVALSASALVYGGVVAAGSYMLASEMVGWAVLAFFLVMSLAMALVQALEMAETIWRGRWTREALPAAEMIARQPANRVWPKVSLHLAICNEPPAMVIQTLDLLARLDHPELRSHRHRQQHQGPRGVASGAGLLRPARRALPLLPLRRHEGLQGRRAQLRADPDLARRQDHRRHRQRLHGAAGLAEGAGAVLRRQRRSPTSRRRRTIATGRATASRRC